MLPMEETPYSPYASPQAPPPQATGPQTPLPTSLQNLSQQQELTQKQRSGAGWFLWVAILSQLNSLFMLLNFNIAFCIGLGISPLVAGIVTAAENPEALELTPTAKGAAFAVGLVGMLFFLVIYFFANRRHSWAFILGMIAYAVDGLIFILFGDFLSIGFHIFALYWMFIGLKATMTLNQAPEVMQPIPTPGYTMPINR